jgi:DNA-binding transcriptional LysR family regulator
MAEADARLFVSVADTGSFTAAAALHDLSPSALSKAVSRLEAALGVRLLTRTTRSLHLTEEGRAFHNRCAQAFRLLAEAAEEVAAGAGEVAGTVRLGLPSLFGTHLVAPRLPVLLARHPKLRVEMVTTMRLSDVVDRGLDLAIVVGPLPDSNLAARPLGYGQFVTVAAPALLGAGAPDGPGDLDRFPLLGWLRPDGRTEAWRFRQANKETLREPRPVVASDDMHHLAALAEAGLGVAHLPMFAVAAGLHAGLLVRLLEGHDPAPKLASFVYPEARTMPRRVRVLMEHLVRGEAALPGTRRALGG